MKNLSEFTSKSSLIFGFIAGITLFYAVTYNFGFFSVLGLHYFNLLTFQDHLSSFLSFAPVTLICFALGLYFDPPWKEDPPRTKPRNPAPTWKRNIRFFLLAFILFVLINRFSNSGHYTYYSLPLILIWINIRHSFCEKSGVEDPFKPIFRWLNYFVSFAIILFLNGAENAYQDINSGKYEDSVIFSNNIVMDVNVLRVSGSGILVRKKTKEVMYINHSQIRSFSIVSDHRKDIDGIDRQIESLCNSLPFVKNYCLGGLGNHASP